MIILAVNLVGFKHDAGSTTKIDTYNITVDASHHTGHNGTNFIFKDGKDSFVFSFAKSLHDYLLGSHGSDTTELSNWVRFFKGFTDSLAFSLTFWDFGGWIISQTIFNHFLSDKDSSSTSFTVKYGANIHVLFTFFFTPSGGNGSFNNIQNSFFWEILLFGDNFHHLRHLFKV